MTARRRPGFGDAEQAPPPTGEPALAGTWLETRANEEPEASVAECRLGGRAARRP